MTPHRRHLCIPRARLLRHQRLPQPRALLGAVLQILAPHLQAWNRATNRAVDLCRHLLNREEEHAGARLVGGVVVARRGAERDRELRRFERLEELLSLEANADGGVEGALRDVCNVRGQRAGVAELSASAGAAVVGCLGETSFSPAASILNCAAVAAAALMTVYFREASHLFRLRLHLCAQARHRLIARPIIVVITDPLSALPLPSPHAPQQRLLLGRRGPQQVVERAGVIDRNAVVNSAIIAINPLNAPLGGIGASSLSSVSPLPSLLDAKFDKNIIESGLGHHNRPP